MCPAFVSTAAKTFWHCSKFNLSGTRTVTVFDILHLAEIGLQSEHPMDGPGCLDRLVSSHGLQDGVRIILCLVS